jgi:hypothetical protein
MAPTLVLQLLLLALLVLALLLLLLKLVPVSCFVLIVSESRACTGAADGSWSALAAWLVCSKPAQTGHCAGHRASNTLLH